MSTILSESTAAAALWIIVKATMLLGVAAIVQAALQRRASAATRHFVWTLAVLGVLVLPVLTLALPDWPVVVTRTVTPAAPEAAPAVSSIAQPVEPIGSSAPAVAPATGLVREGPGWSWPAAIAGIYAAGAIGVLFLLAVHRWRVRAAARHAVEVPSDSEWARLLADCAAIMGVRRTVRMLRSRERTIPMAFGTRRPSILIPAVADTWPDDRRRAVVLHELAHVVRCDCLTQTLAFAACAIYWFHPGAWWIARRLRVDRELACDDRVIAAGTRPREYAGHLLEIAYAVSGHRAPALAVCMARPRQLEGRLLAVLDAARNRHVPALRVRVAAAAIGTVLLLPLAGASATSVTVESASGLEAVGDAAPASGSLPPQEVVGPHLKETAIAEIARRLVRSAADAIGIAQNGLPGTWEIRPASTEGVVHLRLVELNSSSGSNVPIAQLEGLSAAQLTGAGGPVQFRLRRDAGTFTFEGVCRGGVGAGTFAFAADPNFPAELAKRGLARPTSREQYQMARHDIGLAFVDELTKQGYAKPETSELVRAGQHGVHLTYLRDMGALGYRLRSLDPLIGLRDHGVTPAYVRELAEQGYKGLPADELRRARDHGVTPEYVRAMREAGYGSLPMDALVNARDHGVSAAFVRELADAGYRKVPLDEVIRVRDHGVTPEYARELRQLGHSLSLDDLVRARDHGVSIEFVREMAALGYGKLPMDALVRLRDHGVTPKYAQELKALGYEGLSMEDLVTLRDHGLTPERIRAANARAGTRLPIDLLKRLNP